MTVTVSVSVSVALASSVTFSVNEASAAEQAAATVAVTLPIESTAMLETVTPLSEAEPENVMPSELMVTERV